MRVLVTAFEPFGGSDANITQELISLLPAKVGNREIVTTCLPVSFQRAPIALRQAIAKHQPDFILLLGQCPAGENIRLERFAINMMDSTKADNDGYIPNEETIYPHQPLALQTPLPIKELERFCTDHVQSVQVSNSAGLYLCNRVYYEALHMQQNALFVHIPKNFDIKTAITVIQNVIQGEKGN